MTTPGGIAAWFDGAQPGDPAAVEALLQTLLSAAHRFAARGCSCREDAEDAVQEALTALVRRVGAWRPADTVLSWLFVTIRRTCLRGVQQVTLVPVDATAETAMADHANIVINRIVVAEALARQPAGHREVLLDLLGLPAARAAAHPGIGARAARSRLLHARRALAAAPDDEARPAA